jgi:hypothetical protein
MDFAAMFQTWINVLTKPGEAVFQEERHKPHASLGTALIWIIAAAFFLAIFSAIGVLIGGFINVGEQFLDQADLPPEVAAFMAAGAGGGIIGAFCFTLILAPVFFLIGSGIFFVLAKLFGGTGSFEEQTYLLATFSAPIMIVNGVIGVVPILGACVSFFISIYQLVLSYYAIKVSHGLDSGKAAGVVLIPTIVVILCILCIAAVALVSLFGLAASSF